MSLGEARRAFSKRMSMLTAYANYLGYDWAFDQGKRCDDCLVGHPRSTHKAGTGQDINLYTPNGAYPHPDDERMHSTLHDMWDLLGGAERIQGDLNHYSDEWQGVR